MSTAIRRPSKSYAISGIDIYRFENGKVVERWGNADLVSMYRQIGYTLTPPAQGTAAQAVTGPEALNAATAGVGADPGGARRRATSTFDFASSA